MHKTVFAACAMALALGAADVSAQSNLAVPATASTSGPARGLTMAAVEQRYGAPSQKLNAIGQPPITRWVYPGFVVYFEYNLVIHTVDQASTAAR